MITQLDFVAHNFIFKFKLTAKFNKPGHFSYLTSCVYNVHLGSIYKGFPWLLLKSDCFKIVFALVEGVKIRLLATSS